MHRTGGVNNTMSVAYRKSIFCGLRYVGTLANSILNLVYLRLLNYQLT